MAVIDDLVTQVVQATGRPDQATWAAIAINNCVKEIIRSGDFPNDLYEHYWQPDSGGAMLEGPQKIIMPQPYDFTEPPSFSAVIRKICYLAYDDQKLTEVSPQNLLLAGCQEQDVFYRNGYEYLVMNPSKAFNTLKIGVYVTPIALSGTDYHWILDQAEDILIIGGMAKVYKNTGDDASHDRFFAEYNVLKRQFKLDQVGAGIV